MSVLTWGDTGDRIFETGVDRGTLFVVNDLGAYGKGVPWNGLISISEAPSGAEATPFYADNGKYLNLISKEEFGASIEAYTWPDEFNVCDGSVEAATPGVLLGQQGRSAFGLAYRTRIGNDVLDDKYGFKIHLIYGAKAAPTDKAYSSINDSPEPATFSWDITTTPIELPGYDPVATIVLDSTKIPAAGMTAVLGALWGTASTESRLPLPGEILTLAATAPATGGGE